MEEKIFVQMTEKALFDFMLYHTYSKLAGFLSNLLGMAVAFMGIILVIMHKADALQLVFYLLAAAAFIGFTPIQLKIRAKKQMQVNPEYMESCTYRFKEEGLLKEQGDKEVLYQWEQIEKVVATPKTIGFYYGKDQAAIIPKESFGTRFVAAMQIVMKQVNPSKINIR